MLMEVICILHQKLYVRMSRKSSLVFEIFFFISKTSIKQKYLINSSCVKIGVIFLQICCFFIFICFCFQSFIIKGGKNFNNETEQVINKQILIILDDSKLRFKEL